MNHTLRCAIVLSTAALCRAQQPSIEPNAIILAGDGYHTPSHSLDVAPGQVIVLHVHGVTAKIDSNVVAVPCSSRFPRNLNGISVDLIQGKPATPTSLELRAAYQTHCIDPCSPVTAITLQIPFE